MFNVYDLMKSGMSAEEIAAEFTQNLNDAETRIEAERIEEARRREEAKRADAATRNAKREDFAALARLFFDTIGKHYPNIAGEATELTEEECLALADMIILVIDLEAMKMSLTFEPVNPVDKDEPIKKSKVDPFAAFFKQFGL